MAINNQRLKYRPLWAGTMICSTEVRRSGTIGCFATRNGTDRWCLTAAHVVSLTRAQAVEVWQPSLANPSMRISKGAMLYAPAPMDVVAFQLADSVQAERAVLELGKWNGTTVPLPGMAVIKSGCATGVTRGRVIAVHGDEFEVLPEAGMPPGYTGYEQGDSGSAWMTMDGREIVGMHVAQKHNGAGVAVQMGRALTALGMRLA